MHKFRRNINAYQSRREIKNYQDHKANFAELVRNGASDEEQSKAFGEMFDALSNDLQEEISAEVNNRSRQRYFS